MAKKDEKNQQVNPVEQNDLDSSSYFPPDAEIAQEYTRAQEEADLALAAWADEESRRQAGQQNVYEFTIPLGNSPDPEKIQQLFRLMHSIGMIDGSELPEDARAVPSVMSTQNQLAVGLDLDDDTIDSERKVQLVDMVYTYIGVTPRPIDAYCGRWLKCLGAVLAPITAEVTDKDPITGEPVIDEVTGEVSTRTMTWQQPLFKLEATDDITGENIVLFGGGASGKRFALDMTKLFGPGDWSRPRRLFISQEARQGVGKGGKLEPRRMFRFLSRELKNGE